MAANAAPIDFNFYLSCDLDLPVSLVASDTSKFHWPRPSAPASKPVSLVSYCVLSQAIHVIDTEYIKLKMKADRLEDSLEMARGPSGQARHMKLMSHANDCVLHNLGQGESGAAGGLPG